MGIQSNSVKNRVRIKDIALQAGVSAGTVDRVLHERGEVHPETREKILGLIHGSGYTPNLAAKSLANRKSYCIAAIIPQGGKNNPYWEMPMAGIIRAKEEVGDYSTVVDLYSFDMDREESFRSRLEEVITIHPDGVILAPVFQQSSAEFLLQLEEKGIPYVFLDSMLKKSECIAAFGQDTQQSGFLAARLMCYGIRCDSTILILKLARPDGIIHHLTGREKGFKSYIGPCVRSKNIRLVTLAIDITAPGEPGQGLEAALSEYPDTAGIFVTNSRASKVAEYLESCEKKGIILIGYDLTALNRKYLERGTIDFLLSQQPEKQGYKSIMALFRYLSLNQRPEKIQYSPIDIITKENIDFYHRYE